MLVIKVSLTIICATTALCGAIAAMITAYHLFLPRRAQKHKMFLAGFEPATYGS